MFSNEFCSGTWTHLTFSPPFTHTSPPAVFVVFFWFSAAQSIRQSKSIQWKMKYLFPGDYSWQTLHWHELNSVSHESLYWKQLKISVNFGQQQSFGRSFQNYLRFTLDLFYPLHWKTFKKYNSIAKNVLLLPSSNNRLQTDEKSSVHQNQHTFNNIHNRIDNTCITAFSNFDIFNWICSQFLLIASQLNYFYSVLDFFCLS